MKLCKYAFSISIILILIICSVTGVTATDLSDEYDLIAMTEDEEENIRSGLEEITPVTAAPEGHNFECYAVKENGIYAIGFLQKTVSNVGKCTICVYDKGVFQSGFSFTHCNFSMNWNGDNIVVFEGSNHIWIEFSPTGEIVRMMRFPITIKNQDAVYRAEQMKKICEDDTYIAKKQFFLDSGYATLMKTLSNGEKTVLYHANFGDLKETWWVYLFILVAACLSVPGFIIGVIQLNKLKKKTI